MKHKWLHQYANSRLIIFCNGWGMDEHPLKPLPSHGFDVFMLYDYSSMDPGIHMEQLLAEYDEVFLICWSMGVWGGQQLFSGYREQLTSAVAINGTLCPIDDNYGIPEKTVRATLEKFDEKQRLKFYHRMCRDRELYKRFLKNRPKRSVEEQKSELAILLQTASCQTGEHAFYETAIVADGDFIIPTKNQLRFWPERKVRRVDGSHFLFYSYGSWDELIGEVTGQGGMHGFAS